MKTKILLIFLSVIHLIFLISCNNNSNNKVNNIQPIPSYTIGGNISGLQSGILTIKNNIEDSLSLTENGDFVFANALEEGQDYQVIIIEQPEHHTCVINNATGIVASENIDNITITCQLNTFTIGGSVSGLLGEVIVNNQTLNENIFLVDNGDFSFTNVLLAGESYNVTIQTHPIGQTCSIENNQGIVIQADITDIFINCQDDTIAPVLNPVITSSVTSADQVNLSWPAATDNLTKDADITYDIYISEQTDFEPDIGNFYNSVTGTTDIVITNLNAQTTYFFRIIAKDLAGNSSEASHIISATTADVTPTLVDGVILTEDINLTTPVIEEDIYRYTKQGNTIVPEVGNILVGTDNEGYGYIVEVLTITDTGTEIIISTRSVPLNEVFNDLYIDYTLLPSDNALVITDFQPNFTIDEQFNIINIQESFQKKYDINDNSNITVSGHFKLVGGVKLYVNTSGYFYPELEDAKLSVFGEMDNKLQAQYNFEAAYKPDPLTFTLLSEKVVYVGAIPIPIGPITIPFKYEVKIKVTWENSMKAEAKINITATATQTANVELGYKCSNCGESSWQTISTFNHDENILITTSVVGALEAETRLVPELILEFPWIVTGASISTEPYLKGIAEVELVQSADLINSGYFTNYRFNQLDGLLGADIQGYVYLFGQEDGYRYPEKGRALIYSFTPIKLFSLPEIFLQSTAGEGDIYDLKATVTDGANNPFATSSVVWYPSPNIAITNQASKEIPLENDSRKRYEFTAQVTPEDRHEIYFIGHSSVLGSIANQFESVVVDGDCDKENEDCDDSSGTDPEGNDGDGDGDSDGDGTNSPQTGSGDNTGDPHFKTFDGLYYDFQGVGEFIMVESLTDDFVIQTRQQPWGSRTDVAINAAVAMYIAGDKVGFYLTEEPLFINGEASPIESGTTLILPNNGRIERSGSSYVITWPEINPDIASIQLTVTLNSSHINLSLKLPMERKQDIVGLLGNFDEVSENDLETRDGQLLAPNNLGFTELYEIYGESWRISQEESLFNYAEGENTETFTNRDFPFTLTTAEDLEEQAYNKAKQICIDKGITDDALLAACILDVGATGEEEFAEGHAEVEAPKEAIEPENPATIIINTPTNNATVTANVTVQGSIIEGDAALNQFIYSLNTMNEVDINIKADNSFSFIIPGALFSMDTISQNQIRIFAMDYNDNQAANIINITYDRSLTSLANASLVVFNDINIFDNSALSNADNRLMIANLVNYEVYLPRDLGDTVYFDYGHNSKCYNTGICNQSKLSTLVNEIKAQGLMVENIYSSQGTLTHIPDNIKAIFLWNPLTAYTIDEINTLKTFALEGGRIVFIGEHADYYAEGINTQNQLLAALGSEMINIGDAIDCGYTNTENLTNHPFINNLDNLTIACASILELGSKDQALFYDSNNTSVLAAIAEIDLSPITALPTIESFNQLSNPNAQSWIK